MKHYAAWPGNGLLSDFAILHSKADTTQTPYIFAGTYQIHVAIGITDRQSAPDAKQWLEFSDQRWQDGELRAAFEAMRCVIKPKPS